MTTSLIDFRALGRKQGILFAAETALHVEEEGEAGIAEWYAEIAASVQSRKADLRLLGASMHEAQVFEDALYAAFQELDAERIWRKLDEVLGVQVKRPRNSRVARAGYP